MIDLAALLAHAAELFDVPDGAIVSAKRGNDRMAQARQAVACVLREHQYTVVEIGTMLRRDHTTICYALKQARRRLDCDPTFAARYRALAAAAQPQPPPRTVAETVTRRRDAWTIDNSVHVALFFWGIPEPVTA